MPSSISSSDTGQAMNAMRLTASDRPGVAQPVPERDIPARPWSRIVVVALLLLVLLVGAWEWHWRDFGVQASIRNSDGLWAMQRRRIDAGEGQRTVLVGDSRMLFDVDLDTWERLSGERPIQLALEGTSAAFALEDLSQNPRFTGRIVVGVAPLVFFSGFGFRNSALKYYRKESPSQRIGQRLSMQFIEPKFAFYDPDFSLTTVLKRQDWPRRAGIKALTDPRKLAVSAADRNTEMWSKVERDPQYQALARSIWSERFAPLDAAKRSALDSTVKTQLSRVGAAVAKLRARGIDVIFVCMPSAGPYREYEQRDFPRSSTWDVLLSATGVPGIHFEDYPELRDHYELPEWSHLAASERPRFTEALYRIVERDYWRNAKAP